MLRAASTLVVAGGLFVALLEPLARSMIFQPSRGVDLDPAALGIDAESLFLDTEDGVRIHAFFLPGGGKRALLFLHGNAGNASHRLPNAAQLAALGADVLLLDYRGYGLSQGHPSEEGVYLDARAGLAHLVDARGFAPERVVVFGRSIGGAIAVELAADRPLGGLILESTFTNVEGMVRHLFGPLGALAAPVSRFVAAFDSLGRIGRVRAPLLFLHGDRDDLVPAALGRALFEAAPEPKAFETIVGAGHNDTVEIGGPAYLARIGRFLDEVAP
jgi:hypothetical protein